MAIGLTDRPLIVVKLGSSVLTGPDRIRAAGEEMCRLATTNRLVAVVSALPGRTDDLMGMAGDIDQHASADLLAGLLATGEDASVALMAMAIRRAGAPVLTQTSAELALRTDGPLLDAEPIDWNPGRVRDALARDLVVVAPGFVGWDASGLPSILGRGGSDLTALYLAVRLRAEECRLIKDVDGLYSGDPRVTPDARRYQTVTWARALAVGGPVVQPKAVRFAARHEMEFVLTALGGSPGTRVGAGPDVLAPPRLAQSVPG